MDSFRLAPESHSLQLAPWEARFPSLQAGFTIRTGGSSKEPFGSFNMGLHVGDDPQAVISNRQTLCDELGFSFARFSCAEQIHGNKVMRITAAEAGAGREAFEESIAKTDGIYTDENGILLTSFYADCVPLYFIDPASRAIGLAHAGWRGTVGRISEEMIRAFARDFGSKPEEILTAIGPSIGGCCYELDDFVIDQVKQSSDRWQTCVTNAGPGKYMLDLKVLNQLIMEEAGIRPEHILRTDWCTSCRPDLFFSYRKEAGKTGRMASYIGWA
ncbi:peptidoglycan editing factor PgeF [Brevibacillus fluminis]|uniref:peptidoglycan editing factor PgeF n=1 Tax=Brevibacillus fluminis TaxID=511487 RepID=UPI003F894254